MRDVTREKIPNLVTPSDEQYYIFMLPTVCVWTVITFAKNHWILPMHSNVTNKKVSWLHFSWTTLYMITSNLAYRPFSIIQAQINNFNIVTFTIFVPVILIRLLCFSIPQSYSTYSLGMFHVTWTRLIMWDPSLTMRAIIFRLCDHDTSLSQTDRRPAMILLCAVCVASCSKKM